MVEKVKMRDKVKLRIKETEGSVTFSINKKSKLKPNYNK